MSARLILREIIVAYEEANDPCFDHGQVGGEDGEPGHKGRRGRVV